MSKKSKTTREATTSSHLPTALIAGAGGFIGSHLCEVLLHQNCRIYGLDNWTTGKKDNLKHLIADDRFVFLEHDLNKPLKSPLPKIDYVFHLAGVEAYVNGLDLSLETLLVNSLGTKELLEIAHKNHAKFLLASTADIFSGSAGTAFLSPGPEAYTHHEAKRFSEALVVEYIDRFQLDARVVRLDHVYGPRMDLRSGSFLAKLFSSLQQGKPLKVSGQGLTPLYPTYISDLIYGLTKAMFSQSSTGKIYTLLNPQKTNVLNFAYQLKEISGHEDIDIQFLNSDSQEPEVSFLSDVALNSQEDLGWSPKVDLKQGIAQTLKWLKVENPLEEVDPQPQEEPSADNFSLDDLGISPAPAAMPIAPPARQFSSVDGVAPKPKKSFNWPKLPQLPKLSPKPISLRPLPKPSFGKKGKVLAFLAMAFLMWLIIPLLFVAIFTSLGFNNLKKASAISDLSQTDKLVSLTSSAQKQLTFARSFLRVGSTPFKIVGGKTTADNLDGLLFIGTKLSQGAQHLSQAGESATLLTSIIFHHQDGNLAEAFKRIKLNLDQAYSELSFVESELQSGKELSAGLTAPISQKMTQLAVILPEVRAKLNQVRIILPLLPSFVAQDSKKTYLLLFQNSAELRPTGGFIGSFGLLTFDQGKLLDFTVEDIYAADGQLKGYVEPPAAIKEFLGTSSWFFRDSNWDPDFTVAAQQAEWFLQKETGRLVDGVIAVNLPAVREILKATGPIVLADYNEEITADNLFERAEYRTEIDFFPGSTQKRDFLGSLAREIFTKMQNSSAGDLLKFSQSLETSLAEKQLLLYLHDTDSQKILAEQNWAGNLYTPILKNPDKLPVTMDYAYLVDANLGINKANYFLKKAYKQELTILKTKEILSVSTLTLNNQSPADAWPGGVYRGYLRQLIPLGSQLVSLKVGEEKLDLTAIDQETLGNRLSLGFSVTVPVKTSLEVEITYRVPLALALEANKGRLAIVIPKQPGTLADPVEVIVNHPTFLTVAAVSPQALTSPQVVTFQSNLAKDRLFTIDFIER